VGYREETAGSLVDMPFTSPTVMTLNPAGRNIDVFSWGYARLKHPNLEKYTDEG
jgi:hypothetical protein